MVKGKPPLTVLLSPLAEADLLEIWTYNIKRYDLVHAEDYDAFLKAGIGDLARSYDEGRAVENLPQFSYITLKKSRKGDGHSVIYVIDEFEETVNVLRIFHTKMDMLSRLQK